MELLSHIVTHALEDTLPIIPFLLVTYLVLELLEHAAGDRVNAVVKRAGAAGPVVGALAGIVPQCGFSAMGATLYAGRVITLGTLVAVFLSTSDEMLPLLVAERVDAGLLAQILLCKAAIAAVVGLAADGLIRALRRNARVHAAMRRGVFGPTAVAGEAALEQDVVDELAEAGEGVDHIHRLCERDHCGCDDDEPHGQGHSAHAHGAHAHGSHVHECHGHEGHVHDADGADVACCGHGGCGCAAGAGHHHHGGAWHIVRSALSHTVQVTLFIFIVTLVLVAVLETVGEPALEAFLGGNQVLAIFASALVGLIPNCAASVVITQLYLEGVLSFSAMLAGTLVGAGAGFLVLFRTNRSARENIVILVALYVVAVVCGVAAMLLPF